MYLISYTESSRILEKKRDVLSVNAECFTVSLLENQSCFGIKKRKSVAFICYRLPGSCPALPFKVDNFFKIYIRHRKEFPNLCS